MNAKIYNGAVNKLLRNILVFVIIAVGLAALAVWQPWTIISRIPGVGTGTALTVNVQSGKAEVNLDGDKVGETPFSTENIASGDHQLELIRISSSDSYYEPIQKQIYIEADTRTFVEAEIGPGRQFSSLKLVYYRKGDSETAGVYIDSTPTNSEISIDEKSAGTTPYSTESLSAGRHTLEISADGYENSDTVIIVREGFTLIAEMQLMAKPIEIPYQ